MKTHPNLPFEKSHAFIIGINAYKHVSPLSTAVNDAEALAKKLAEDHGYEVHPPLLDASKKDMMRLFEKDFPEKVGENDRVLFYFAGHGIALNSDDDPKGYLVPADAKPGDRDSLISMELLHKSCAKLPCQHGILILDCCFAGAFKWSTGFRDVIFDLPGIIYEQRFYQYAQDPAWQVITSSAADQKAVDILTDRTLGFRNEDGAEHSPFARALLDGLDGEGDTIPKGRGDGVITATELYTYLRDRVEDETMENEQRQSPSMFSLQKHDKGQYIFFHPRHPQNLPPIPDRNPFMGLRSYNESDHNLFYGRDRVIEALDQLINVRPLVVVSGASGTGKSSVIKAGLLPQLRENGWNILPVIRPGKEPMEILKSEVADIQAILKEGTDNLLIIDQYEELITQCLREEDWVAFEAQLLEWIKAHPKLRIIISIRSDFEPQFEEAGLKDYWQAGRYVVPAFNQDELREVIIKPTIQEVLFFEPDSLVDKLVDAVNQAPGALPLLSFTLSELYHAYVNSGRTNRAFIEEDYEKLGGVIGALRTRANSMYESLDQGQQDSMRALMLRMVSLEGGELASRRVMAEDLIFSSQDETDRIQQVADMLVEARLISSGRDKQERTYYEPSHDALVRAWSRLWEWIKALGEGKLSLLYKLHLAVNDFRSVEDNEKEAKKYLWNEDPRLGVLYADMADGEHSFNAQEESFVKTSMLVRRKNQRNRNLLIAGVIAVLLAISGVAIWQGVVATNSAEEARLAAELAQQKEQEALLALEEADSAKASAIRSANEAQIAQQRTVDEMIAASWKLGTLFKRGYGLADLLDQLKLLMDLPKLRTLSPVPVFLSGPHTTKFNSHPTDFAHYNPAFLAWAKEAAIPATENEILRNTTQPFYDDLLRPYARMAYLSYNYLETHPQERDSMKNGYLEVLEPYKNANLMHAEGYSAGSQFLVFGIPNYIHHYHDELAALCGVCNEEYNGKTITEPWPYWTAGYGFWIRRGIHGTEKNFFEILEVLLQTYDREWYDSPHPLP
ncbi:MAG: caspase family protein, partial [Bacteroidota bacterium]